MTAAIPSATRTQADRQPTQTPKPSAHADPATAGAEVLSVREVERVTGVASERLRTWNRRHGFPETILSATGERRVLASDLPAIVAAKQLIGTGEPAGAAIARAREAAARPVEVGRLAAAFDALDVPVIAYRGPEPLSVVYANPVARLLGPDETLVPERTQRAYRTLQALTVADTAESLTLWHPCWQSPSSGERCALAFTLGAPTHLPAIAVMMDLPGDDASSRRDIARHRAQEQLERRWLQGLTAARRAAQRSSGAAATQASLGALVETVGATDGFLVLAQRGVLHPTVSVRGARRPARLQLDAPRQLPSAAADAPRWIDRRVGEPMGLGSGGQLVVPLLAGGALIGHACIVFEEEPNPSATATEALLAFGTLLAAAISRDRVAGRLRTA